MSSGRVSVHMSSTSAVLKEEKDEKDSEAATASEADGKGEEEKSLDEIIDAYSE